MVFIIAFIASISVFPIAASAECTDQITAGDRGTLRAISGYTLKDDYVIEISYLNYTLYSSGVYRAFIITFDRDYCNLHEREDDEIFDSNALLSVFELLFSSRGYTLEKDLENARFTASIKYDSFTDLYIGNGIDGYENDPSSGGEKKGFLYNEYTNTQKTEFSYIETPDNLFNGMLQLCYQLDISKENILLNYTYGTPYKIIKTDADETKYLSGQKIYTHSYDMTMDNYDREITLTQVTPNTSGWYTLAIGIALIVLILPLTFVIIRKKDGKNG